VATEAHLPAVNQHDAINNENTINKITITFYQKRTQAGNNSSNSSNK
jgi:truncated hemoglobin YjbI